MDDSTNRWSALQPTLNLSAHQQNLLFAALNSNNISDLDTDLSTSNNMTFTDSPVQQTSASATVPSFDDSPFVDYEYDFDAEADGNFEYDFNPASDMMVGNIAGTSSSEGDGDLHDKRSHPDDEGDENEGGGKRREGEDKTARKPGRKPLTSEPTSVRGS